MRSDRMLIDAMVSRFDFTRRDDYGLFLHSHYSALRELRPNWRAADHEDLLSMAHCLQEDLHAIGIAATKLHPVSHAPLSEDGCLGIAYVVRGSRLGSVALRHRVQSDFATSYLDFSPTLSWSQFLQDLEERLWADSTGAASQQIIAGAKFALARVAFALIQSPGMACLDS